MNEQTQAIYDKIEGNRFEVERLQNRIAKRDWRAVRKILTTSAKSSSKRNRPS